MTWNYRVIRHKSISPDGEDIEWLQIHEVYYHGDKVESWVAAGAAPVGETYEELMQDMTAIQEAFDRPILNAEDMPK